MDIYCGLICQGTLETWYTNWGYIGVPNSVIKTALNVNFGISALRYRFVKEKKKRWEPIVSGIAIIYGVGVITALYSLALYGFLQVGKTMQHPEIVLTVAFMIAQVLVFFLWYLLPYVIILFFQGYKHPGADAAKTFSDYRKQIYYRDGE